MTPPPVTNQSALQAQITALGETVSQGFNKLESMLNNIEERVRAIENAEAGSHPLINSRLDAVWKKVDQHEADLKVMKEDLSALKSTNRILTGLGGLLASTVIVWLVTQILAAVK